MKTIQIPTGSDPLIVTINNDVYSYKAGESVEVPDDVAAAIEDALALVPKPGRNISKVAQLIEGSIAELDEKDMAGIDKVWSYAFYNCDKITQIVVPKGAMSVEAYAFAYCDALTKVVLPETINSINGRAFSESHNLTSVVLKAIIPPTIRPDTIGNIPKTCIFKVPSKSLGAYKSAELWSEIADQIVALEE